MDPEDRKFIGLLDPYYLPMIKDILEKTTQYYLVFTIMIYCLFSITFLSLASKKLKNIQAGSGSRIRPDVIGLLDPDP
jgi:hypothetical protein